MAIETAFILPILIVMSLGGFETSRIVSRQFELQSVAGEAEVIAIATASGAETSTTKLKNILKASADLDDSQITISRFYRCNANAQTVSTPESCNEDDVVTDYVRLVISDTYTPIWTDFGVGKPVDMQVERTVLLP
ncbi:pilus assembly protein [Altererythrobacter arenosus]|uniref:Pilus assembly protein n=1 Tax=Altererythrobacter arenosus TaxID=3032592 RepID=A0ABY8FSP6_9SPHN|nr:TadE/TadG family type IV pilus assembly protein [Altererythrobacter sp. CAU 1644]WFL77105.1 pilus assembly protein [Altererythrobacter sp. CAU 1644]